MNKIYILSVHKKPTQLKRLIEKLDDDSSKFYIHVDLKADINIFLNQIKKTNVCFIKNRLDCIWGDFSQVLVTINLLKNVALENHNKFTKVILLSGQDYPIKRLSQIDNYFIENKEYEFISFDKKAFNKTNKLYINRVLKFAIKPSGLSRGYIYLSPIFNAGINNFKSFLSLTINGQIKINNWPIFFNVRRKSIFKKHFKGSNWWAFNLETVLKLLKYIELNENELYNYYQFTSSADEQFFHTILKELMKNDANIKIKSSLHFIDWERKDVDLPVTFTKSDFQLLKKQPEYYLFARKFDSKLDEEILNLIDKNILNSN
ncbi:beta-1,6-N-acetylglucosaminyltransferase [Postechiella marina]|uniref:Peptide O-xylosyltransferase n=1 Tax=Postechiella marina TaxID=943941 RepID=A0ABP8C9C9_9FLAO